MHIGLNTIPTFYILPTLSNCINYTTFSEKAFASIICQGFGYFICPQKSLCYFIELRFLRVCLLLAMSQGLSVADVVNLCLEVAIIGIALADMMIMYWVTRKCWRDKPGHATILCIISEIRVMIPLQGRPLLQWGV